jgi:aromatic ring-opening dioxygenase catalytic subunit (LigB family)
MERFLRGLGSSVAQRPRAVLVISGHWETEYPTVNAAAQPSLLFDYYGFPEHAYRLSYPAPGAPGLAAEVRALLDKANIASDVEGSRGLDHGVFIPFMLIYPDADIPILQLSLQRELDPEYHLALGRALAPLRDQGVLIVGSGMSYHNLREMSSPHANEAAGQFDDWLAQAATDAATRDAQLIRWQKAPGARAAHPTAEHLLPLMVAAGAAEGETGEQIYSDLVLGKALSGFRFG